MEAHARRGQRARNLDAARVGSFRTSSHLTHGGGAGGERGGDALAIGGFAPMTVRAGEWRLEGDALKFDVKTSGMAKGDVTLPEDSLHFEQPRGEGRWRREVT